MKIQCSCGAKYAFDVTPEMAQKPIKFICQSCGQDSSDFVNDLIRREYPVTAMPPAPTPAAPVPPAVSRLRIAHEQAPAEPAQTEAPPVSKYCSRHRNELVTDFCVVCKKPICRKCLAEFGYFCSPLCKGKAEAQKIVAPVYAGQKFEVERKFWRKTGLIFGSIAGVVVLFLGIWTWYAWIGSVPHLYYAVHFDESARAHFGSSQMVGQNQLIFLHGGLLARCDLKSKKQIWSQQLVTKEDIADQVKRQTEEAARENAKYGGSFGNNLTPDEREKMVRDDLEGALTLRVSGQNIWVGKVVEPTNAAGWLAPTDYQLTHYDWDSGRILQQMTVPFGTGEFIEHSNELLLLTQTDVGAQFVTHVSLADGTTHTEEFHDPGATKVIAGAGTGQGKNGNAAGGGLFASNGQPLDPNKVAAQAQDLKLPARIALPALIASAQHEQQLEAAMRDDDSHRPRPTGKGEEHISERFQLIPSENGYIQFAAHLLEEKLVTRNAMKTPTGKSIVDSGNVNGANETQAINEQLNEMQRNRGGSTVTEDVSLYQVSLRRTDSPGVVDWTGEVTGPPSIFPLKTVNVLTAGKTLIVFDKSNKKLWEATLTYNVQGYDTEFLRNPAKFGEGPCVEHGDTLYIFDQAVLTAYDITTGNARWRLPSVGVVGLFFDDQGMLYVNTTSANPDDLKYSRQIDISKSTDDILLKVDPKDGKTLWRVKPGGFISYVSGKFIYAYQSHDPNPTDEEVLNDTMADMQKPPYIRIVRLSPNDGRVLWDYENDSCPVDVQFDQNSIELVYKKSVQVLRYLSLF